MKLYQSDGSPFAARVRLALYIKSIDVDMPDHEQVQAFLELSPTKMIPALELDNGRLIPESEVICEYLEDRFPDPPAFPSTPFDRMRARLISRMFDLYLLPALKPVGAAMMGQDIATDAIDEAIAKMTLWTGRIEEWLDAEPYAVGERISYVDGVLIPLTLNLPVSMKLAGLPNPFEGRPKLAGYLDGVKQASTLARKIVEEVETDLRKNIELMGEVKSFHSRQARRPEGIE